MIWFLLNQKVTPQFRFTAEEGLAVKTATLGQIQKVLKLLESVSSEQLQAAFENGSLSQSLKGTHLVDFAEFFNKNSASRNYHASDSFLSLVVSKSRPRAVTPKVEHWDAEQEMNLSEAKKFFKDYGSDPVFRDMTEVCSAIAGIISRADADDEKGGFLFLESCVVTIIKHSDGYWRAGVLKQEEIPRFALRVYLPPLCPSPGSWGKNRGW